MPHLDIKFQEKLINGNDLYKSIDDLKKIIGKHFNIIPDYISAELVPQSKWVSNRKPFDLELNCDPDNEGLRLSVCENLTEEISGFFKNFLQSQSIDCEFSVWVRIYSKGVYKFNSI